MENNEMQAVHDGFALLSANQKAILKALNKRPVSRIKWFVMGMVIMAAAWLSYPLVAAQMGVGL